MPTAIIHSFEPSRQSFTELAYLHNSKTNVNLWNFGVDTKTELFHFSKTIIPI